MLEQANLELKTELQRTLSLYQQEKGENENLKMELD